MNKFYYLGGFIALCAVNVQATEQTQRLNNHLEDVTQARAIVKQFSQQLKAVLKPALEQGGPVNGLDVCSVVAPKVAQQFSRDTSWQVGRTSLKYRNEHNAPDDWERAALLQLEQKKEQQVTFSKLEYWQVVTERQQRYLRYVKAIPTAEKPCLACHGGDLPPQVSKRIAALYPHDKAVGYRAGEIRGAFTLTKKL